MRLRIFSLMLTAFGLVIVLGICGMMTIFWLAVSVSQQGNAGWGPPAELAARAQARRLADYYERSGSWAGVDDRFAELERGLLDERWRAVTLVDARGRVVRSSLPELPAGELVPPVAPLPPAPARSSDRRGSRGFTVQSVPIQLRDEQVGALMIVYDHDGAPPFGFGSVARGLLAAGLALAFTLLGLAAVFSGRISKPLRQLNGAAQAMAEGDMDVRVRPGLVREVADLAVSFNRMADSLVQADQQRRQLTADVAHELRTPLSIIKGRLEGIQDGVYRADGEQIEGLLGEVALLERLIEDLRILALAEAGQLALYPEAAHPARLLQETARSFAQQAEERGIRLQTEADDDLPELTVDLQRIAQVLGNLVGNALRHTPEGGSVTLSATCDQGMGCAEVVGAIPPEVRAALTPAVAHLVFSVCDTGAGIRAEDLPRVFDRFYRADRARSRSSGGAGLGLAIARRIIESHHGAIWAASEVGRGTTVSFALPLEPP